MSKRYTQAELAQLARGAGFPEADIDQNSCYCNG